MRIRWRGLELPHRVVADAELNNDNYGKFVIEPFERGFGTTVGNSLRRILLSSVEGAAVTRVKIDGVQHEFSTLNGPSSRPRTLSSSAVASASRKPSISIGPSAAVGDSRTSCS